MTKTRLSVFPLAGALLFPRMHLPLHIFEPRYRAMVSDAMARDRRIGMIQPRPVAAGVEKPPLFDLGCIGRIAEVEALDDGRYNKVANTVGNTMKYHPHGDASITDALVGLGQKELLIDTQGNWGNIITGDPAAVNAALRVYRVYAKKVPLKDGDYTMDHTAVVYLMDKGGHFVAPFNLKQTPEAAADQLRRYL